MLRSLPIPISDAISQAEAAGISARLLVGLRPAPTDLLVALRSTDPESTLHMIVHPPFGPDEILLARRVQSGPERWDYPVTIPNWGERYLLRLQRGTSVREVPLLPASLAIIHVNGWTDDTSLLGEPVVAADEFRRAVADLSTDPPAL